MSQQAHGAILLTGGAQRVGLHCALDLLARDYPVIVTYRTPHRAIEELQAHGAVCLGADFSQPEGVLALIAQLRARGQALRAVIHNASAWLPEAAQRGAEDAQTLQTMVAVHMLAPYLINLHCRDLLEAGAAPWADIIHITDYVVEKGSDKHIAYAASKAGMDNMTKSFAKLYAPKIKVNTIAPSLLMFNPHDDEAYRRKTLDKSVLGIEPGPGVVADAIRYLMDNSYMTGRTIALDGGRHIR